MSLPGLLRPGATIAGYTIQGVLGRGGMGTVYRATHRGRAEPVALKLIASGSHWGDAGLERFEREARLAAAVAHRGILPVYEAGDHEGQPFVAMKLEASDLGALLREHGRLGPAHTVSLVSQLASALDAAHAHGLVHRDVKPTNVLLGEEEGEERAYLADFGVARATFSEVDLFQGEIVGTVAYASPEQIRGELVDHRTDVYALGCLLYECLTGRVPYVRGSALATFWAHLHDEPAELTMLVPALPRGLDELVRRALAKRPDARFVSAGELAETARAAVDGGSWHAQPSARSGPSLPVGTVTFLVVQGMHEELEKERQTVQSEGGVVVDVRDDRLLAAFADAEGALRAARAIGLGLAGGSSRVRIGIHTGTPHRTTSGYAGADVHRPARIAAAAYGGQILLSSATAARLDGDGSTLRPLGLHRLDDFPEPVALFQLGDGSFPPLKTIANTNLPAPASSFLGREQELHEADLLLQATRVLSVTGPGGAGKTRFALELATRAREERFSDHEDGVFVCFLASLRDPALVLPTIAQALSVVEQPGNSALQAISEHIGPKRMLLLLDNVEHMLPATGELSELLAGCPALKLLVTSRERLSLADELTYELPPLAPEDSVALFCERADREPSAPIGELCSRLEGLPLAIELAAASTSQLTPEQLVARLSTRLDLLKAGRDADPRQQTLRATIEWSYDLLAPEAQSLFAGLSVFAGGCTLEAAEAVCGADLDSLESLLDKSLLRRSGERFWLLETIREFAAELLEQSGEADELRRAHAQHFSGLAERAGPDARGRDPAILDELAQDDGNFRAALQWTNASGEAGLLAQLAAALGMYWATRGPYADARAWLECAYQASIDDRLRARVARGLGAVCGQQGDYAEAWSAHEQALELARRAGDRTLECSSLGNLSVAALRLGEAGRARQLLTECRELARELGDELTLARVANTLGNFELIQGRLIEADLAFRETLVASERLGELELATMALSNLGFVALHDGRTGDAARHLRRSLRDAERLQYPQMQANPFVGLAALAFRAGDPVRAARLLGAAGELLERAGVSLEGVTRVVEEETRAAVDDQLGEKAAADASADGRALERSDAIAYALAEIDRAPLWLTERP